MAKMVTRSSEDIPNIWQAEQSAEGSRRFVTRCIFHVVPVICMASNALDRHSARASSRLYWLKSSAVSGFFLRRFLVVFSRHAPSSLCASAARHSIGARRCRENLWHCLAGTNDSIALSGFSYNLVPVLAGPKHGLARVFGAQIVAGKHDFVALGRLGTLGKQPLEFTLGYF